MYWLPKLRRLEWVWLAISAVAWIFVFAGLRMLWPATKHMLDVYRYVSSTLRLSRGSLDLLIIISPVLLVLFNIRQIPAPYLRLALCSVPWLLLHFFTSQWHEIRYYMPLLIWLLPSLAVVFSGRDYDRNPEMIVAQRPPALREQPRVSRTSVRGG